MNTATLIGRLGKDPVLRVTESGKEVAEFTLAVDNHKSRKDRDANRDWFTIVAWGPLANAIATNKRKGDRVAVHGRLTPNRYEKDGVTHYTVKITANEVQFLDNRRGNDSGDDTDAEVEDF